MKIAVITGASSGMGREFVTQLDQSEQFDELWLIARRKDRLEELQASVRARALTHTRRCSKSTSPRWRYWSTRPASVIFTPLQTSLLTHSAT